MTMTQYGIGVTRNRFELFGIDDEDPLEVLKFHEQEREARKRTKQSEKENKGKDAVTKNKTIPSRKGIKETQNLKPHDGSKGKEDNKSANVSQRTFDRNERKLADNREDRNNHRNRSDGDLQREDRGPDRLERKEMRGNFSVGGQGNCSEINEGGAGGRSGTQRIGRIGTRGGVTSARGSGVRGGGRGCNPVTSKGTAASDKGKKEHEKQAISEKNEINGGMIQSQEDSNNRIQDKQESEAVTETIGGVTTTEIDEVGVPEEDRRELTLDEWKAMKAPRQKPTYNLRKAGEGEDLSQWKKMYALQKKKDGVDDEDEDEYEYESCEYPQRVGRQKHILDIDIHFKDTRSGGRSRGGRGAGRGGNRVGGRAGQPGIVGNAGSEKQAVLARGNKSAPKVDDEHDFPSLG